MSRPYDSTVARLAGNIAAGLVRHPEFSSFSHISTIQGLNEWTGDVAILAVKLARAIVAETQRTEPQESDPCVSR